MRPNIERVYVRRIVGLGIAPKGDWVMHGYDDSGRRIEVELTPEQVRSWAIPKLEREDPELAHHVRTNLLGGQVSERRIRCDEHGREIWDGESICGRCDALVRVVVGNEVEHCPDGTEHDLWPVCPTCWASLHQQREGKV